MPRDFIKKLLKTKDTQGASAFGKKISICLLCNISLQLGIDD